MTGAIAYPKLHVPEGEDFLLLSPTEQAYAYRNVDRMFVTRAIRRGIRSLQLPRGEEISPRYQAGQDAMASIAYFGRANVAGLLVIRDEKIVLERYALGLEENVRWSSMSMIKSLTSTLIGAALQQGAIASLDDAVSKYIPALRGCAYDAVTIRHLITMSSGVRWNEDYTDRNSDVNRYSKSLGDKVPGGVLALMRSLEGRTSARQSLQLQQRRYLCARQPDVGGDGKNAGRLHVRDDLVPPRHGVRRVLYAGIRSRPGNRRQPRRDSVAGFWPLRCLPSAQRRDRWHASASSRLGRTCRPPAFVLDPATNRYGATGYGYSWWIDPDGSMVALGFAGQALYVNRKSGGRDRHPVLPAATALCGRVMALISRPSITPSRMRCSRA